MTVVHSYLSGGMNIQSKKSKRGQKGINSFPLVHMETFDEKKEMFLLFCNTGKNGFSFKRRLLFSVPRDFQQRFPFFSCFSDSTTKLKVE